jgi:hypothetical protein
VRILELLSEAVLKRRALRDQSASAPKTDSNVYTAGSMSSDSAFVDLVDVPAAAADRSPALETGIAYAR